MTEKKTTKTEKQAEPKQPVELKEDELGKAQGGFRTLAPLQRKKK